MDEVWRPVVGFEGFYEVSDAGRVRSLDRLIAVGRRLCRYRGQLLRPGRSKSGHVSVAIGRGNSRLVHALVLEAFVGPAPVGHEARHLNGVESDNALRNLKWDTRSNNTRDKKWHRGAANYKLSPSDVRYIKRATASGCPYGLQTRLAEHFNVSSYAIYAVRKGLFHTDVTLT